MRPLDTAYMWDLVPIILGYVPLTLGMALVAMAAALILRGTLTKGAASGFIMELPRYQMPRLKDLAIGLWQRDRNYAQTGSLTTAQANEILRGTGGTAGVPYLAKVIEQVFFPELLTVRIAL
mgnify:CR=1 FL=1